MIQESVDGEQKSVLPITSVVMTFRIRGMQTFGGGSAGGRLPPSGVSGLRTGALPIEYAKGSLVLAVFFREGGAFGLLRSPIDHLFGLTVPLSGILKSSRVSRIEEQLSTARTNRERVSHIERFLHESLAGYHPDPLIEESIRLINSHGGRLRIAELIDRLPISLDAFEKRFKRLIGTTPKHFSSIVRMRSVIDNSLVQKGLTETALAAGYFDQAHFIREFQRFTGKTPRDYFRTASPAFH